MRSTTNKVPDKKRIFVDMDGTLAEWRNIDVNIECLEQADAASIEEYMNQILYLPNYFSSLSPHEEVVNAVKSLVREKAFDVYVLSCVLPDKDGVSPSDQKHQWLNKFLPEVDMEHRIFVPNGEDKKLHLPGGIKQGDILLDDYTKNLLQWEESGIGTGVKVLNYVNSTKGKWNGSMISCKEFSDRIVEDVNLIAHGEVVVHDQPDKCTEKINLEELNQILTGYKGKENKNENSNSEVYEYEN